MAEDTQLIDAFTQLESREKPTEAPATKETEPASSAPSDAKLDAKPEATPRAPIRLDDDETPIEFTVGKDVVKKLWKEIKQTQVLLPQDYQRKTEALASDRKAFLAEQEQIKATRAEIEQARAQFDAERKALAEALRDPRRIEALYLAAVSGQPQGQPQLPNQPPQMVGQPVGQGQPRFGAQPQQPQQPQYLTPQQAIEMFQQWSAQQAEQVRVAQVNQERAGVLEKHVSTLLDQHRILKAFPDVSEKLYEKVAQMVEPGRTTVDEAKQMLSVVVENIMNEIKASQTVEQKTQAANQSKLQNGIEPRGGTPTLPKPRTYDRKKGLDDPEMERDIIAYLNGQAAI